MAIIVDTSYPDFSIVSIRGSDGKRHQITMKIVHDLSEVFVRDSRCPTEIQIMAETEALDEALRLIESGKYTTPCFSDDWKDLIDALGEAESALAQRLDALERANATEMPALTTSS